MIREDTRNGQFIVVKRSPVNDLIRVARKYNVMNMVMHAINGDTRSSYEMMKNKLKKIIWCYEEYRWKSTCFMYKGIDIYNNNVTKIEMHPWWHAAHENPSIVKNISVVMSLLLCSQTVGMQCDLGKHYCSLCGTL